jgi:hypothetical protein
MKRRPVLISLALVFVALFADDVRFLVQWPTSAGVKSIVAVDADCPAPMTAFRPVDGAGALLEVARNGRPHRDLVAMPFAGLPSPAVVACIGAIANLGQTPSCTTSLVSQHTRLQI